MVVGRVLSLLQKPEWLDNSIKTPFNQFIIFIFHFQGIVEVFAGFQPWLDEQTDQNQ